MIASDSSRCFSICTWCLVHSLAVVEVTDFLVVVGKGKVFLMAIGKVAVLEVVNVKVAPDLEGVVVEVASTSVAVVSGTRSSKWSTLK